MRRPARAFGSFACAVLGVVLVFTSLSAGWWSVYTDFDPWTVSGHEYHFMATSTFLPGAAYHVQCWVNNSSLPGWGGICESTGSGGFTQPYDPGTHLSALYGNLFLAILVVAIVAVIGFAGWVSGHVLARSPAAKRSTWFAFLAAAIVVMLLPLGMVIWAPAAYSADHAGIATTSFWGSCSSTSNVNYCGINTTQSWGPGPGWYCAFLGGGLLLAAAALGKRLGATEPPFSVGRKHLS